MGSTNYTITPASVGTLTIDRSQLMWGQGFGTKIQIPVLMFYVEGGDKRILVDTGCSAPESAAKYHYPFIRKPEEDPTRALEAIGVNPSEIDIVVATHLHWDHCYNHELFTNARFFIQRTELQRRRIPSLQTHTRRPPRA
jgi:N-acyl homoserine lactone hydrolase